MSGETCDVCGKKAYGVASSTLGAISFAYCEECLGNGAEPYGMLVAIIGMLFGNKWKKVIENDKWILQTINSTLQATGKTREELDFDVDKSIKETDEETFMMEQLNEIGENDEGYLNLMKEGDKDD